MAIKIWRGDAPAVAQITHVEFASVQIGDVFTLSINGKTISVTATAATSQNVVGLFVTAIGESTIPEWGELTAEADDDILVLTAAEAGKPFTVTGADSNGSVLGVSVSTTVSGVAGVNATQVFAIPVAAGGTWTITIGDQTTSALAIGANAATVQTAVTGLSTIGTSNCAVSLATDANDHVYTMTFQGSLAATNVSTAIVTLTSDKPVIRTTQAGATTGTPQNEIQTVDCGTGLTNFTLTLSGQTTTNLSGASTADNVRDALVALSNVETVTVTKAGTVFTVEFTGIDGGANQAQMTASVWTSSGTSVHLPTVTATQRTAAVNEVQTVTLTGAPTGGTFTLTYSGQTTSAIAYNASAATVDAALEALSNIGAGDVAVTGSDGGPWTVTFTGALAGTNVGSMTGNGSSLTGGSSETITVSSFVASSGPNHWDTAANWVPSGVPANSDDVRFEIGSSDCLYGLAQSSVTLASLHVSMSYSGKIGLPRNNADGYLEYRPCELAIGATSILIGHGDGSGPGKVALNVGSVQTTVEVRGSGGSTDIGIPAVTWRGTHASNVVTVLDGDFGTAPYSDQTAVIDTLTQRGGSVALKHTTLSEVIAPRQNITAYDCTLGGQPLEL